jgi:hypothetical protein
MFREYLRHVGAAVGLMLTVVVVSAHAKDAGTLVVSDAPAVLLSAQKIALGETLSVSEAAASLKGLDGKALYELASQLKAMGATKAQWGYANNWLAKNPNISGADMLNRIMDAARAGKVLSNESVVASVLGQQNSNTGNFTGELVDATTSDVTVTKILQEAAPSDVIKFANLVRGHKVPQEQRAAIADLVQYAKVNGPKYCTAPAAGSTAPAVSCEQQAINVMWRIARASQTKVATIGVRTFAKGIVNGFLTEGTEAASVGLPAAVYIDGADGLLIRFIKGENIGDTGAKCLTSGNPEGTETPIDPGLKKAA